MNDKCVKVIKNGKLLEIYSRYFFPFPQKSQKNRKHEVETEN